VIFIPVHLVQHSQRTPISLYRNRFALVDRDFTRNLCYHVVLLCNARVLRSAAASKTRSRNQKKINPQKSSPTDTTDNEYKKYCKVNRCNKKTLRYKVNSYRQKHIDGSLLCRRWTTARSKSTEAVGRQRRHLCHRVCARRRRNRPHCHLPRSQHPLSSPQVLSPLSLSFTA